MENEDLIAAKDFCVYHQIEYTFISSLEEAGLIELKNIDQEKFIMAGKLPQLEKLTRLHHELELNIPSLEVIVNLLERIETMQQEITSLRNRLSFYS